MAAPPPPPPRGVVPPGFPVKVIAPNLLEANIVMGFGGVEPSNPEFYRLKVMNYILGGGGFSSRLVKIVPSEHRLAYSINSGFETGKFQSSFTIGLQTKKPSSNEAIDLVLQKLREIQENTATCANMA